MKVSDEIFKELFESFWLAGMVKVKKKNARLAFYKIIKAQHLPHTFTKMLIGDIEKRLEIGQFGFSSLHPTSYLNGERWEDEYRGQVNETHKQSNQSFSDTVTGQAARARERLRSANSGVCGDNTRAIRSIGNSFSESM
ncbi:MAG: hypothetical protein JKX72_02480 [Robiginitomaculum sp.]|nr:hypothetical protein [Robiginitomaculum sp.]